MFSQIFRRRKKLPLHSRSFRPGMENLEGRFPPGNLFGGLTPLGWWGSDTISQTTDPVTLPNIARTALFPGQVQQNSNRGMPDDPESANLDLSTGNLVSLVSPEDRTAGPAGKISDRGHIVSGDSLAQDSLNIDNLLAPATGINPGIGNGDAGLAARPRDLSSALAGGDAHGAVMSEQGVSTGFVSAELNRTSGLNRGIFRTPNSIPQVSPNHGVPAQKPNISGVQQSFGQLPMRFETNLGQTDSQVQFLARGQGYGLFLTSTEAVMTLQKPARATSANGSGIGDASQAVLRMEVVGGNPSSHATGLDPLSERVNYFIGNDPAKWQTGISTYGRVEFQNVYAGINLAYYGTQQQMEYDFIVTPGANPNAITLGFSGTDQVAIDPQGDLVLTTSGTVFHQHKPFVYQESAGTRQEITSHFVWKDAQHIGFEVGTYNPNQPLVIDPTIQFSDYLGGSGIDETHGVAVDPTNGFALMTGLTTSTDFPTVNAIQGSRQGGSDAFVAFLDTFNVLGYPNQLVYVTYLGGSNSESGNAIAVDPYYGTATALVTGFTNSTDFPTTAGAFQTTYGGGSSDAFVTRLNADGTMAYSTYLGGSGADEGLSIAMDTNFDAVVTGYTSSSNFPTSAGSFQPTYGGGVDAF
ncbi:MAG TPA: SBBP repeat-containing protein, partial [Gemmataceae bacterium]|nr:SBBP repeat-containing protein [Gemmataceae bacterium]